MMPRVDDGVKLAHGSNEADRIEAAVKEISDLARELRLSLTPPRGAPFYGLDSDFPFGMETLGRLREQGIFRKYGFILVLGSGLGGASRWLALQLGCRVLGIEPTLFPSAVAGSLSLLAHLDSVTGFLGATFDRLPLTSETFTHVLMMGRPTGADLAQSLLESRRVLRPGGHFVFQSVADDAAAEGADMLEQLASHGFESVEVDSRPPSERDGTIEYARRRLRLVRGGAVDGAVGQSNSVQVLGRRPS